MAKTAIAAREEKRNSVFVREHGNDEIFISYEENRGDNMRPARGKYAPAKFSRKSRK